MTDAKTILVPEKAKFGACYSQQLALLNPFTGAYLAEKTVDYIVNQSPMLLASDKPVQRSSDLVGLNARMAYQHFQFGQLRGGAPQVMLSMNDRDQEKICRQMQEAMFKCVTVTPETPEPK